jgi:hypothetical protein
VDPKENCWEQDFTGKAPGWLGDDFGRILVVLIHRMFGKLSAQRSRAEKRDLPEGWFGLKRMDFLDSYSISMANILSPKSSPKAWKSIGAWFRRSFRKHFEPKESGSGGMRPAGNRRA